MDSENKETETVHPEWLSVSRLCDAEGNAFYERNGSIDLWDISDALRGAGRQIAPVRLTDRNTRHILASHPAEVGATVKEVIAFLDKVLTSVTQIRKGRGTTLFAVVAVPKTNKAAVIRLYISPGGDYYNVESCGKYRDSYWKEEENEILWERSEPSRSESVSDSSMPHSQSKDGNGQINAEDQRISKNKDTE